MSEIYSSCSDSEENEDKIMTSEIQDNFQVPQNITQYNPYQEKYIEPEIKRSGEYCYQKERTDITFKFESHTIFERFDEKFITRLFQTYLGPKGYAIGHQLIGIRHELNAQNVVFQNHCLAFIRTIKCEKPQVEERLDYSQIEDLSCIASKIELPSSINDRQMVINQFRSRGYIMDKQNQKVPNLIPKSLRIYRPSGAYRFMNKEKVQDKFDINRMRDQINLEWLLDRKVVLMDTEITVFEITDETLTLMNIMKMLHEFFNDRKYQLVDEVFQDQQNHRCMIFLTLLLKKLFCFLIQEALEPISIKIDCDKDEFPEIMEAIQEERHQIKDHSYLITNSDNVFFTPNFFQLFDLKGISDQNYLKLKLKFNAIQIGFKLDLNTKGKNIQGIQQYDDENKFQLCCSVGDKLWKERQIQMNGTLNCAEPCRFLIEYFKNRTNNFMELTQFTFHHSHPLSLEYHEYRDADNNLMFQI